MSDTTNPTPTSPSSAEQPRRRFLVRAGVAAAVVAAAAGLGIKAFAHGRGVGHWPRGGFLGASLDPARLDERLDRMLEHLYVEIDATDAQKQQLAPIVKGAAADLLPLRARMREGRRQGIALLTQEHIDRAALETLRAEQLQQADEASRRLTQALADAADILTVSQRKQLAGRIGRWRGHTG
jgi:periplasmic protein CpxP/Spy